MHSLRDQLAILIEKSKRSLALVTRFKRSIMLAVIGCRERIAIALADCQKERRWRYRCHATACLRVILPYADEKIAAFIGRIEQQTLGLFLR